MLAQYGLTPSAVVMYYARAFIGRRSGGAVGKRASPAGLGRVTSPAGLIRTEDDARERDPGGMRRRAGGPTSSPATPTTPIDADRRSRR